MEEDIGVQEEVGQMDTARTFSVEEKLTSDKFDESFVKFMNGNGGKLKRFALLTRVKGAMLLQSSTSITCEDTDFLRL